jgi:hypothetical protein
MELGIEKVGETTEEEDAEEGRPDADVKDENQDEYEYVLECEKGSQPNDRTQGEAHGDVMGIFLGMKGFNKFKDEVQPEHFGSSLLFVIWQRRYIMTIYFYIFK